MFEDVGIGQDARWLMIRGRWTLLTCRDGSYRWDDNRRTAPFELHMGNRRLDQVVIQFRRALGIGEISVQRAGLLAVFRRTSTLTATHAYRSPMRPASWATAWSVMASTSARCPQFCLHIHHEAGLGQLLLQLALLGHKAGDLLGLRVTARLRPRGTANPASAPASRALRHSTIWLEYKPSRRNNAPFAPSGAASSSMGDNGGSFGVFAAAGRVWLRDSAAWRVRVKERRSSVECQPSWRGSIDGGQR
jgi:hypothetical protein